VATTFILALVLGSILSLTSGILGLTFFLLTFAFGRQFGVSEHCSGDFLNGTSILLGCASDAIFVHFDSPGIHALTSRFDGVARLSQD